MTAVKIRGSVASSRSDSQENEATQLSHDLEVLSCLEMSRDQYIPEKKPDLGHGSATDKSVVLDFFGFNSSSGFMDLIQAPEKYKQKIESFNQDNLVKLSQSLFEMLWPVLEENYQLKNEIKQQIEQNKLEVLRKLDMNMAELHQEKRQSAFHVQDAKEIRAEMLKLEAEIRFNREQIANIQRVR